jgi:aerobic carbon-monoxide dehydrogenase medium subunit
MKPALFSYRDPRTLEEALELLAEHGDEASLLAGGQSLVPLLNLRLARPSVLIDVNRIPGLDGIEVREDRLRVGALVRAAGLERHTDVASALPVVREALRYVAHPQIRNRTTIGGNLAHADPAAELPAIVAALDGTVTLVSRGGQREVSWRDFFRGMLTTARRPDEMVAWVELPRPPGLRLTFLEVARRHGDFALAGACVGLSAENGTVADARIALIGVGGTPVRVPAAEESLIGGPLDAEGLREMEARVRDAAKPIDDVHASADYRRALVAVLARRGAAKLAEGSDA